MARGFARIALVAAVVAGAGSAVPVEAHGVRSPLVSVGDVRAVEGSTGAGSLSFPVRLDVAVHRSVTVTYEGVAGTASPGGDFTPVAGSVVISAGERSAVVTVPVVADSVHESPRQETVELQVTDVRRARVGDGVAVGTIVDDDLPCSPYTAPRVWACTVPTPEDRGAIDPRVLVLLPASYDHLRALPVVYLLHGVADSHRTWVDRTDVETHAAAFDAIVVMPDGGSGTEAGWYSDWADGSRQWETFHTVDLVQWVDRSFATMGAGHRAVAGASMGGLGALYYAAEHPDVFSAAASISGFVDTQLYGPAEAAAFIVGRGVGGLSLGTPDQRVWGLPHEEAWTAHNPAARAAAGDLARHSGRLWLRTGDGTPASPSIDPGNVDGHVVEHFVWQTNRSFLLKASPDTRIDYAERAGTHDWVPFHENFLHDIYAELVDAVD